MKYSLLLASVAAIDLAKFKKTPVSKTPWLIDTLEECPDDFEQKFLADGVTAVVRYPHVGANCRGEMWPESLGTREAQAAPAL